MVRILLILSVSILCLSQAYASTYVRGYFKSNGTYVAPHFRSSPDGNFYNNWSTKGNYNPYTGEEGTKESPTLGSGALGSLKAYYGIYSAPSIPDYERSNPPSNKIWNYSSKLEELPPLNGDISEDDSNRSNKYCEWLSLDPRERRACKEKQLRVLVSIIVPDYSELDATEVNRSANYCEWLYGDNRAAFYNCINTQVFGLKRNKPNYGNTRESDIERAKKYCEWLYGDNRSGYLNCERNQANKLKYTAVPSGEGIDKSEWGRAKEYCEWLYGNNRSGVITCLTNQSNVLTKMAESYEGDPGVKSHCERLYGNNRAGYWKCVKK